MAPQNSTTTPWLGADGTPVACRDKLRVLEENARDAQTMLQDVFEDALLMGVGDEAMRRWLHGVIDTLRGPKG